MTRSVPWVGWAILLVAAISLSGVGATVDLQKSTPFTQCVWRATSCIVVMAPWALWSLRTQGLRGASDPKTFALMIVTAVCWSGWFAGFYYGIGAFLFSRFASVSSFRTCLYLDHSQSRALSRTRTCSPTRTAPSSSSSTLSPAASPCPRWTPTVIGDVVAASSACFGAAFLVLAKKFRAKVELSHYMWLSMVVNLPMSLAAAMILEDISFSRPFDPAVGVLGCLTREQIGLQLFISVLGARA